MKSWLFWTIPALLFIAQLLFILNSQNQIRYEDLAESVRNVFWLQNREVYDGVSSNVGWYGTLLIIYQLFGFHLHAAQFFKLALYLVSMICLGLILKKYVKEFWTPFLVVGLSPTLLYYGTIQASHGIDLLYFPIVLFLITHPRPRLVRLVGWALSMWAWMSYPSFVFYLPALAFLNLRYLSNLRNLSLSLAAFLMPLFLVFIFVQNKSTLIFDPKINSGIFRGAGGLDLSFDNIFRNLMGFFKDLFLGGSSYHFEVNQGDFSLIFPVLTVILVLILSFRLREIRGKGVIGGLVLVLILSSFTSDPSGAPGMRRYTPVLAAFYALFVVAWQSAVFKKWGMVILSLLLIHHLIVYPLNLVHLKDPSPNKEPLWFSLQDSPQKSLDSLVETVQKEDLKLVCLDKDGKPFFCRVSEAYAAVAGSCKWNHLDCHQILGWDFKTNQSIPLNISLWDDYYFEH